MLSVRATCVAFLLASSPALAGPASDAVRFFYTPPTFEADASLRERFVDPAKAKFEENDKLSATNEIGCIDWVLAIDAQDYDDQALAKSLRLDETVAGDTARVTASFKQFDDPDAAPTVVEWSLKQVGGQWKIADIESKTNEWKLSELDCDEAQ